MTTCTPDYLHEDLIDCERRGITGDVCPHSRSDFAIHGTNRVSAGTESTRDACRTPTSAVNWPLYLRALWGATPPPHPVDFPRCEARP